MISRRAFLSAPILAIAATVEASAKAKITPADFVGLWSGRWDDRWPMSIRVESVEGTTARVHYTWPDGASDHVGTIKDATLQFIGITMTLDSPKHGAVVGHFPSVTRSASVTKD